MNCLVEAGKDNLLDLLVRGQLGHSLPHRNFDGEIDGEPVNAATDGRECKTPQAVGSRNGKTGSIATR